jgi:acetyltransferase-like isoleucine patch superfamily enzyme
MIVFCSRNVGVYDSNNRFIFENYGCIIFEGSGVFKSGSSISVGSEGILKFGDNFSIGPLNKIVCFESIYIKKNALFAWEIIILDTDFHFTLNLEYNKVNRNKSPIIIGANSWIGSGVKIYKGTVIPDNTIVAGMSVLNKNYNIPRFSLIGGNPAEVKKTNITRLEDDNISHSEIEFWINEFASRNLEINNP